MLENYLVFTIDNQEYAASLSKVPIILIAKKYLSTLPQSSTRKLRLPFEGAEIQLIDITKLLNLKSSKLTLNSRLLVGQLTENFFGFVVDDVNEIIMLDEAEIIHNEPDELFSPIHEVYIKDRTLKIISIDNVIESVFENEMKEGDEYDS